MSRRRKYRGGRIIKTMAALIRELEAGRYIYQRHKLLHPGWWGSWQLNYARSQIHSRRLSYAKPINQE